MTLLHDVPPPIHTSPSPKLAFLQFCCVHSSQFLCKLSSNYSSLIYSYNTESREMLTQN